MGLGIPPQSVFAKQQIIMYFADMNFGWPRGSNMRRYRVPICVHVVVLGDGLESNMYTPVNTSTDKTMQLI
jgi:hypothetical protein